MQAYSVHHLVHNESCTCHIAGVLHKGDAKIQDKDIGQEHYNAADTADDAVGNHVF